MYNVKQDVSEEVIPLSMADMEFNNAPEIREGLQDYLDEAILGYSVATDSYYDALIDWNNKLAPKLISSTSASKSFNLAGWKLSSIIIENQDLRTKYQKEIAVSRNSIIGPLAYKGTELAYQKGEPWLDELLTVIDKNQKFFHNYFKEHCPNITAPLIEGTYLQWINMNALGLSDSELKELL